MAYAVVRIRGRTGVRRDIKETLRRLKLTRINHAVVIPETDVYKGMLQKSKDYITWGEVERDTLSDLLLKRAEKGNRKLSKEELESLFQMKFDDIVENAIQNKLKLHDYIDPFRLHPPRKGYKSIKLPFRVGGDLGYRGKEINALLRRMM